MDFLDNQKLKSWFSGSLLFLFLAVLCQRHVLPTPKSWLCASLLNIMSSDVTLVVWNQPSWDYLHLQNRQMLYIRA